MASNFRMQMQPPSPLTVKLEAGPTRHQVHCSRQHVNGGRYSEGGGSRREQSEMHSKACGVYTPRCAQGLRCYPRPDSELPLKALVLGEGTCEKRRDAEYDASSEQGADNGEDHSEGGLVENIEDGSLNMGGGGSAGRKHLTSGMKEMARFRERVTEQHRQMGKGGKHQVGSEEPKKLRPPAARTPCQQELDQVLERISTMRLPDERGPLEHLYALLIPNCDKHGLYNLKQCKMSVNGQRGECWCVNPNTGKVIQEAPTIRGDPECHLFYSEQQEARGVPTLRMQ
ncbi:PREDICTED: insulin-like growth factor-binding protein 2 [Galeopterus variegatus]|uniref:Insulin-like growth factor-binding protein 2 n=1 Tax=Galeopterus variegatus TaxID=482537 RepID=A0ABM0RMU2_GALVR|nr:PREDICTED: insulin-like growth factor-binding protein 2 [Galeopterus variegatus]